MYGFLADLIVAVHLVYVGYVVIGQLAIMAGVFLKWHWVRNPAFRWSHLAMICIVAGEALLNFECPLTTWERDLRKAQWQAPLPAMMVVKSLGVISSPLGDGPLLAATALQYDRAPELAGTFLGRLLDGIVFPGCDWGEVFPIYYGFAGLVIAFFILAPPRGKKKGPHSGSAIGAVS
jgi:hypothetical protein